MRDVTLAVGALHALAQALSAIGLYGPGHAAREKAFDEVHRHLTEMLEERESCAFTFLGEDVVYADRPLREMKNWGLAARLSAVGLERIEFGAGLPRTELGEWLIAAAEILAGRIAWSGVEAEDFPSIRFGPVGLVRAAAGGEVFSLEQQSELARGLAAQALANGRISAAEARAVLNSLQSAMGAGEQVRLPLLPPDPDDPYSTPRALNTAVMAMGLAHFLQLGEPERQVIGEAALLHDIGMVALPVEVLTKPGRLSDTEWRLVQRHTIEGARILMRSGEGFEAAAVAALEHHLDLDGTGYPALHYRRPPHRISQLVRLCDVYDAMRSPRAYEGAQSEEQIMRTLREGAGDRFAADLVEAFLRMLTAWEERIVPASTPAASV